MKSVYDTIEEKLDIDAYVKISGVTSIRVYNHIMQEIFHRAFRGEHVHICEETGRR